MSIWLGELFKIVNLLRFKNKVCIDFVTNKRS